jgi:hypothetical protein
MSYNDDAFNVIERSWFGLPRKYGGQTASGFTIGSGTAEVSVLRWYPKTPCTVMKVGAFVLATVASAVSATGSVDRARVPIIFEKSSANGTTRTTVLGSCNVVIGDTGRTARFGIASREKDALASREVEAGRFISIRIATANSHNGTKSGVIGTIMQTGTLAYFIDWKRKFSADGQWG